MYKVKKGLDGYTQLLRRPGRVVMMMLHRRVRRETGHQEKDKRDKIRKHTPKMVAAPRGTDGVVTGACRHHLPPGMEFLAGQRHEGAEHCLPIGSELWIAHHGLPQDSCSGCLSAPLYMIN
jgi:hypothetical protein